MSRTGRGTLWVGLSKLILEVTRPPFRASLLSPMGFDESIPRRSLFSALGPLPALRLLDAQQQSAQQEQPKPTFSTGVKVVNLFANVRNKTGAIVKDLTKDEIGR